MEILPYAYVPLLIAILAPCCEALATANRGHAATQPSPAPTKPPPVELVKRQLIPLPANVCGWVDGESTDSWYVLNTANTCWFNSDVHVVASPFNTACVAYADRTAAASRSSVITCEFDQPFCQIVTFPSSYSIHYCGTEIGKTYNIELTYTGLGGSLLFPYYTGSQGTSIGTQYGSDVTPPLTSTTSSSTTTATPTQSPSSSSTPIGPILGGVLGGVAVICITIIAIVLILRKRHQPPPSQPPPTNHSHFSSTYYQPVPVDPHLAAPQYELENSSRVHSVYMPAGGTKQHDSVVYDPVPPTMYSPLQSGADKPQTRIYEAPT